MDFPGINHCIFVSLIEFIPWNHDVCLYFDDPVISHFTDVCLSCKNTNRTFKSVMNFNPDISYARKTESEQ